MLGIKKTIKLTGVIVEEEKEIKQMIAEIDENAVTIYTEYVYNKELYNKYRKNSRKAEKEFQDKIYEVEDQMLTEE